MQYFLTLIMLLNMGVFMTVEYTGIGDFFQNVIGTTRIPIAVIIGVVSSAYTAYGGLYVSIITDQYQVCTFCAGHGSVQSLFRCTPYVYVANVTFSMHVHNVLCLPLQRRNPQTSAALSCGNAILEFVDNAAEF
jgi:hypothetical protein